MIVIDMDIPTSCCECPMCHPKGKDEPWNYACFQEMMDINLDEWDEKRHPNCPIKCNIEDIKAEIEQVEINGYIRDVECFRAGINTVLNVIDKHKTESEG